VHRAEHLETGRVVALKLVREVGDSIEQREVWLERFRREARAIGRLDTPHVVQVLDAGRDAESGAPFIAMELLEGQDLKAVLGSNGILPPSVALRLVGQACRGLAKAHAAGVVHRDIKPGNLFIARQADGGSLVKVLDFGIAKLAEHAVGEDLTKTGHHLGTPRYMSPEQAQGLKNVDARSDVWALGIVLYRCLAGVTPFDGYCAPGQLIVAISTRDAPPLSSRISGLPEEVHALVHRCLSRRPRERHADAGELLVAIESVVGSDLSLQPEELIAIERGVSRSEPPPTEAILPLSEGTVAASAAPALKDPTGARANWRVGALFATASLLLTAGALALRAPSSSARLTSVRMPEVAPIPRSPPVAIRVPRRTLALVNVTPTSARVSVNGAPVELQGGKLTLEGEIGSVQNVTLEHRGQTSTSRVVLSETGAIPEKLTLGPSAPPPKASSAEKPAKPPTLPPPTLAPATGAEWN